MTSRTWIGGGNNKASNPNDWSPSGAPQAGDFLNVLSGATINITNNDLQGDPLRIFALGGTAPVTINLSHHAGASVAMAATAPSVNVNIFGTDSLSLSDSGDGLPFIGQPVTINLAEHAKLLGDFNIELAAVTVLGGEDTRYINSGNNVLTSGREVIDTDVHGHGAFVITSANIGKASLGSSLEFGGFVSRSQTIELTGTLGGLIPPRFELLASLKIDEPEQFHGTVDLHDHSLVDLVDLAKADSWSYRNDMLTIKNAGDQVIERLHVVSDSSSTGTIHGLSVSVNGASDVLVRPGTDFRGSLLLATS